VAVYYDVVILEMAADHPGDIGYLTHYYRPDIAVLTNVGPSHLTNYPSLEAIAAEKGILVDSVREGGTAVLNADDPRVQHIGQDCEAKKIWYGLESGDLRATKVESRSDGISYALSLGGGNYPVTLPARGGGGLFASLAALGVVTALGLNLKKAVLALKSFEPPEGRLQVHKLSNFTLIDDSYNASPASMMVALDFLQSFPGRKLAILGEMRELGAYSDMGHREVGTRAKEVADKIIAVAEGGRLIAESAGKKATWVATAEEASKVAQSEIRNGDTVLVKASRGVQLDKVVEVLQSEDKRDSIRSKP
jgi:UDP-N-acetylmuramoyl-tripeptide--D-alanyl-D-alanine ligase